MTSIDHQEDTAWHSWTSPLGLGLLALCLAGSIALLLAALSLFV